MENKNLKKKKKKQEISTCNNGEMNKQHNKN